VLAQPPSQSNRFSFCVFIDACKFFCFDSICLLSGDCESGHPRHNHHEAQLLPALSNLSNFDLELRTSDFDLNATRLRCCFCRFLFVRIRAVLVFCGCFDLQFLADIQTPFLQNFSTDHDHEIKKSRPCKRATSNRRAPRSVDHACLILRLFLCTCVCCAREDPTCKVLRMEVLKEEGICQARMNTHARNNQARPKANMRTQRNQDERWARKREREKTKSCAQAAGFLAGFGSAGCPLYLLISHSVVTDFGRSIGYTKTKK